MSVQLVDVKKRYQDGRRTHEAVAGVSLTLEPGTHTLQLVVGDHLHIPHDPPVRSEKITITVVAQ